MGADNGTAAAKEKEVFGDLLTVRIEGWEQRLASVVADHAGKPFSWGNRDCATLFSRAVEAVTGENPASGMAPWFSEKSARRSLSLAGFDSVQHLVMARFTIIHPSEAQRGDIGYCAGEVDPLACPSIIVGSEVVAMTPDGWAVYPRSSLAIAYQVG